MEGIRMNSLEKSSQLGFFWQNLEFNFRFHPRYWGFALSFRGYDSRRYFYKTFRFRFVFIQIFFPCCLVRKPGPFAPIHAHLVRPSL